MTHNRNNTPTGTRRNASERKIKELKTQLRNAKQQAALHEQGYKWACGELHTVTEQLNQTIELLNRQVDLFNVEKNAKNKAYSFILQNGLFDSYVSFSRANTGRDFHADCVNWFANKTGKEGGK